MLRGAWALSTAGSRSDVVRTRVRATWVFRTRAEIEATARFARIATELAPLGVESIVVEGVRSAAEDEARHRDLCARIAERWGAIEPRNHTAPRERIGRSDMEPRDRLLWEIVSVCCIGETMNTALMTRCLEVAKDPEIRDALHELLKDEVRHSRLGWAHLSAERAAGRGAFLADVLPLMLEASIEPGFLEGRNAPPWVDELYDYGELPHRELVEIFSETLNLVIFRGFDAMGIDTSKGRAWLAAQPRPAE